MRVVSEGYDGIMFYESVFLVTFALFWILISFDFFGLHGFILVITLVDFFWGYEWDGAVYFVGFGNWFPWHYFKTEWASFVGPRVGRLFIFVFCKYIWCLLSVRIKF